MPVINADDTGHCNAETLHSSKVHPFANQSRKYRLRWSVNPSVKLLYNKMALSHRMTRLISHNPSKALILQII